MAIPCFGSVSAIWRHLAIAMLTLAAAGMHFEARAYAYPYPVIAEFADPDVLRVGSTYYAYSTAQGAYGNVPTAVASNIHGPWRRVGDAFPRAPAWSTGARIWAPGVAQLASNRFALYFTAQHRASGRQCIGVAIASTPTGPFVPTDANNPLVCPTGEGGAIDASTFRDSDGRLYLLYKNDGNAVGMRTTIYLHELNGAGTGLVGSRYPLTSNSYGYEGAVVEAPTMIKRNGVYILFYSANSYEYRDGGASPYLTSYAVSRVLRGSYSKASRPLISGASTDRQVNGPGGQAIVTVPGDGDYIMYHGWTPNRQRTSYVAPIGYSDYTPVVVASWRLFEAEAAKWGGATTRLARGGASGGYVLGMIDTPQSYVRWPTIYAPRPGKYQVRIRYDAGLGAANHLVYLNSAYIGRANYGNYGWGNYRFESFPVTLKAGLNELRLAKGDRWAQIDYIEVK